MNRLLDGSMICEFVSNEELFQASIESVFDSLDANNDGFISFAEMARELISLRMLKNCLGIDLVGLSRAEIVDLQRDIFARYDRDGGLMVDLEGFGEEMREMLVAVASQAKSKM